MRQFVRIASVVALLMFQQMLSSVSGSAQVDPCNPVPIPGLCPSPSPNPSPSPEPSPSPPPNPTDVVPGSTGGGGETGGVPGGGGGGKAGLGGGAQGQGKQAKGAHQKPGVVQPPVATGPFRVSSPNNSAELIELLMPLGRYGLSLQDALLKVVGPFPVAGLAYWTDDWHACRDGCTRLHEGLDIFAQAGTPLVAIADGYVSQKVIGELSGTSVEITDDQGVQYFYAHLSAWAEGINPGMQVETGQVIGYVGNTGNAISTPPHLHLEVQPDGIPAPPKPLVDGWLKIAEAGAQELVARFTGRPAETTNFRLTRLFDLAGGGEVLDTRAQRLLALTGLQPSVSSLELARGLLDQMAWEIDWAGQADAQLAELAQQYATLVGAQDLSGASPWAPLGVSPRSLDAGARTVPELGD